LALEAREGARYDFGAAVGWPAAVAGGTHSRLDEELPVIIRNETDGDVEAIGELTKAAFATLEISQHNEQFIIERLRADGALSVSLVAEVDGRVVGHVAFSPVTISDGTPGWYGLGPVSVLPERQRQGIGSALIEEGLARLKARGGRGCLVVGHPDYYPRFGFRRLPSLTMKGVPPEVFLGLPFDATAPSGAVAFHPAFAPEL
jgi:putative acetyltransferase